MLQSNLQLIQEREQIIARHLDELKGTRLALEDLKKLKLDNALIPIGSGNFINGKLTDIENIIVSVGAGIAVKKKREDALEIIDSRVKELQDILGELNDQGQNVFEEMQRLQEDLERARV